MNPKVSSFVFALILILGQLSVSSADAWGPTGHRVVGDIAEMHLTPWAEAEVKAILGTESLARASTWADEIRSDRSWDHSHPWHYINLADDETLDSVQRNPDGDILLAMETFTDVLRQKDASHQAKVEAIRFLAHFIGDVHQPLHAGYATDRGGNDIQVIFFREPWNLHAVWDSGLINEEKLSFTELVRFIHHPTPDEVATWQDSTFRDWVEESIALRRRCYDFGPQNGAAGDPPRISFEYKYAHMPVVRERLVQAGVRLAGVLNEIFEAPQGHEPL